MKRLIAVLVPLTILVSVPAAVARPSASGAYLVIELDRDTALWTHVQTLWTEVSTALGRDRRPVALSPDSGTFEGYVFLKLAHREDRDRALGLVAQALRDSGESDARVAPYNDAHPDMILIRPGIASISAREQGQVGRLLESARAQISDADLGAVTVVRRADDSIAITASGASEPADIRQVFQRDVVTLNAVDDDVSSEDLEARRLPQADIVAEPIAGVASVRARPIAVRRSNILSNGQFVSFTPSVDPFTLESVIMFRFDREGTREFCEFTGANVGKRLAILISGALVTAPVINEPICGGRGQISGTFTQADAVAYSNRLNSGSLPAPIVISGHGRGLTPSFDTFSARQISAMERLGDRWGFVSVSPESSPLAQPYVVRGPSCGGRKVLRIHFNQEAPRSGGLSWQLSFDDSPQSQLVTAIDLTAAELRAEGQDQETSIRWDHDRVIVHTGSADLQFQRCVD